MQWFVKMGLIFLATMAVVALIVMLLWNWLMPYLFGLPSIDFWRAGGLLLLSKIIFGFGIKPGWQKRPGTWKPQFADKWQKLPEQDKEKWKARFAEKWGCKSESEKKEEFRQA